MTFLDYNRTVIGHHGTRLSVALDIVQRKRVFAESRNRDDWLGHGVYFWEYGPRQAMWWARRRQRRQQWGEPLAVLGSMIRLGNCFDLLDPLNVDYLETVYDRYRADLASAGQPLPNNANQHKYRDCAVFQYAYRLIEQGFASEPPPCLKTRPPAPNARMAATRRIRPTTVNASF